MPAKRHNGSSSARGRPRGSRRGRSNIGRHTRDTKARRESRANLSAEQVDEIRERNRVAHQEARANLSQERADEIRRVDREAHRQARANLSQRRAKEMRHADREAHQQARVNLSQGRPDGIRHVDRESHQQDRENISQERAAKIRDANRVVHQEARTNSSQGRADEIKQADRESHQQARAIFTDGELEILRESDRLAHERSRREMNEIELLMVRQGDVIRRRLGIPINIRDREGEVREKLIHCVEGRRVRNVESIVIRRAEAMANMTDEERIEATCLRRARTHENVKNKNHILSEGNQDQNRIVKRDDLVDVKDYSCVKNGFAEPTVQSLKTEGTQSLLLSLSHNGDEHNAPGFLEKLDQGRPFINDTPVKGSPAEKSPSAASTSPCPSTDATIKVRLMGSDDFFEVELSDIGETYNSLVKCFADELDVSTEKVAKVRKLPNILIRKDRDVKRVKNGSEFEVELLDSET